jgi:hypothetical protein
MIQMETPLDKTKVNGNNLGELLWWSAHLGTWPEKLQEAITKAGPGITGIRLYLQQHCCRIPATAIKKS